MNRELEAAAKDGLVEDIEHSHVEVVKKMVLSSSMSRTIRIVFRSWFDRSGRRQDLVFVVVRCYNEARQA